MLREGAPIGPEKFHRQDPLGPAITTLGEMLVEVSQGGGVLTPEIAEQRAKRFVKELVAGLAEGFREASIHEPGSYGTPHRGATQASIESASRVLMDLSEGNTPRS
jgi:hypothetical protein